MPEKLEQRQLLSVSATDDTASITAGDTTLIDAIANDISDGDASIVSIGSPAHGQASIVYDTAGTDIQSEYQSNGGDAYFDSIDNYVDASYGSWSDYFSMVQAYYGPGIALPTQTVEYTSTDYVFAGIDSFAYTIADADGQQSTATISVTVGTLNPAVAVDDTADVAAGLHTNVDVLANDTYTGTPTIVSFDQPAHGSVELITHVATEELLAEYGYAGGDDYYGSIDNYVQYSYGGWEYYAMSMLETVGPDYVTPVGMLKYTSTDNNFSGSDSFNYTISDAVGQQTTATVTVEVVGNQAPIANADTTQVLSGEAVEILPLVNDLDPEGTALELVSFTQAAFGLVEEIVDPPQWVVDEYTNYYEGSYATLNDFVADYYGGWESVEAYSETENAGPSSGKLLFTATGGLVGDTATFTYVVRDQHGLESVGTVDIQIIRTVDDDDTAFDGDPDDDDDTGDDDSGGDDTTDDDTGDDTTGDDSTGDDSTDDDTTDDDTTGDDTTGDDTTGDDTTGDDSTDDDSTDDDTDTIDPALATYLADLQDIAAQQAADDLKAYNDYVDQVNGAINGYNTAITGIQATYDAEIAAAALQRTTNDNVALSTFDTNVAGILADLQRDNDAAKATYDGNMLDAANLYVDNYNFAVDAFNGDAEAAALATNPLLEALVTSAHDTADDMLEQLRVDMVSVYVAHHPQYTYETIYAYREGLEEDALPMGPYVDEYSFPTEFASYYEVVDGRATTRLDTYDQAAEDAATTFNAGAESLYEQYIDSLNANAEDANESAESEWETYSTEYAGLSTDYLEAVLDADTFWADALTDAQAVFDSAMEAAGDLWVIAMTSAADDYELDVAIADGTLASSLQSNINNLATATSDASALHNQFAGGLDLDETGGGESDAADGSETAATSDTPADDSTGGPVGEGSVGEHTLGEGSIDGVNEEDSDENGTEEDGAEEDTTEELDPLWQTDPDRAYINALITAVIAKLQADAGAYAQHAIDLNNAAADYDQKWITADEGYLGAGIDAGKVQADTNTIDYADYQGRLVAAAETAYSRADTADFNYGIALIGIESDLAFADLDAAVELETQLAILESTYQSDMATAALEYQHQEIDDNAQNSLDLLALEASLFATFDDGTEYFAYLLDAMSHGVAYQQAEIAHWQQADHQYVDLIAGYESDIRSFEETFQGKVLTEDVAYVSTDLAEQTAQAITVTGNNYGASGQVLTEEVGTAGTLIENHRNHRLGESNAVYRAGTSELSWFASTVSSLFSSSKELLHKLIDNSLGTITTSLSVLAGHLHNFDSQTSPPDAANLGGTNDITSGLQAEAEPIAPPAELGNIELIDPDGEISSGAPAVWYNPFTWFNPWFSSAIPNETDYQELYELHEQYLAQINEIFGTNYASLADVSDEHVSALGLDPDEFNRDNIDPRDTYTMGVGAARTALQAAEAAARTAEAAGTTAELASGAGAVKETVEQGFKYGFKRLSREADDLADVAIDNIDATNTLKKLHPDDIDVLDNALVNKTSGSYVNKFASGKEYVGKGGPVRAKRSASEIAKREKDPLLESEWEFSIDEERALMDEARKIRERGGIGNLYNRNNSPGERLLREIEGN